MQYEEKRESVENVLKATFRAVNAAGIPYVVLRPGEQDQTRGARTEIDLLVAPHQAEQLRKLLEGRGFLRLPAWGHAPHQFYVSYDAASGTWIKFDVVTELCYGQPLRYLRFPLEIRCRQSRQAQGVTYIQSPEEEFTTLLLHCLLDKACLEAGHRRRLEELRCEIEARKASREEERPRIEELLPGGLNWEEVSREIAEARWQELLRRRGAVKRKLMWRAPIGNAKRWLSNWMLRRLQPLLRAAYSTGKSVALLGPDGAGKSELATRLSEDVQLRAKHIHMGHNFAASTVGLLSTGWLRRINEPKSRLLAAPLKALRFANRVAEQWYRLGVARYHTLRGRMVVFDRFVYDSWLNPRPASPWKRMRRGVLEAGWPTPDLVIALDAPGDVLFARKKEHSPKWLEEKRQGYRNLRARVPQLKFVDATMASDEVLREVTKLIWARCGSETENQRQQRRVLVALAKAAALLVILVGTVAAFLTTSGSSQVVVPVVATVETDPVPTGGDAADDPAIWVNPNDPSLSTILGTDKGRGLGVYDLSGKQIQFLPDGRLNNVDLRNGFPLGGERVSLVTAGNRTDNSIAIYRVQASTRMLEEVAVRKIHTLEVYGSCMYRSPKAGATYYFVSSKQGEVEQWELFDNGAGKVDARKVRRFHAGAKAEGCVADDELGILYLAVESQGIRKYGAEPNAGSWSWSVDTTGPGGHLGPKDVEGLTLYRGANGAGYLIASNQGASSFAVYRLEGTNAYVGSFQIVEGNGIDGVTHTDGIAAQGYSLGPRFPRGIFVAQDNENDGHNQNFKMVPWRFVEKALEQQATRATARHAEGTS